MTTFALVKTDIKRKEFGVDTWSVLRINNNVEKELEKHNITPPATRQSRKHAVQRAHVNNTKIRLTSQIGLVYLKPVVGYSTSVYFHSKDDFRANIDNRYGQLFVLNDGKLKPTDILRSKLVTLCRLLISQKRGYLVLTLIT